MKRKWDARFWWLMAGLLIFGVFLISAFEGIGYVWNAGTETTWKLHDIAKTGGEWKDVYGTGIAAIVIAWVTMLFPIIGLFINNKRAEQWMGIMGIMMIVAALALGLASEGVFTQIAGVKDHVVKGKEAGVFVLVIFGGLFALGTSIYACVPPKANRHHNRGSKSKTVTVDETIITE